MFLAGGGAAPERTRLDFFASDLVVDGAPVGHLSDHAAVLAEISWRKSPAAMAASAPERRQSRSVADDVGAGRIIRRWASTRS